MHRTCIRLTIFVVSLGTMGGSLMTGNLKAAENVAIAIHAGAGTIRAEDMSLEQEQDIRTTLERAASEAHKLLSSGGSSLDAVTRAVTILEDSPHFNAGRGAVFNAEGKNELDASIMDGKTRNAGAVTGVHNIRNPILLARAVMEHSRHVMLMGEGAELFAREQGLAFEPDEYFHTDFRWKQLEAARASEDPRTTLLSESAEYWYSTVGAVALDQDGNLAAATSTGGMTNKRWGRIGDSPIIGAGTYADNRSCAVSATGHGEYFIRQTVARDICARMQYRGDSLETAARQVVMEDLVDMEARGGVISVDSAGNLALVFNTPGMYRAQVDTSGHLTVAIYADETPSTDR